MTYRSDPLNMSPQDRVKYGGAEIKKCLFAIRIPAHSERRDQHCTSYAASIGIEINRKIAVARDGIGRHPAPAAVAR
jgi:hypothetical protein